MKKIQDSLIKKQKFVEEEKVRLKNISMKRKALFSENRIRKRELLMELNQRRQDILDLQSEILKRASKKYNTNELKRTNASEKTVIRQMNLEKNLDLFYKTMSNLKSQSIFKKSPDDRYKIYKQLKREEAEKKRKEQEEEYEKRLAKQG